MYTHSFYIDPSKQLCIDSLYTADIPCSDRFSVMCPRPPFKILLQLTTLRFCRILSMTVLRGFDPGVLRCRIDLVVGASGWFLPNSEHETMFALHAVLDIIRFVTFVLPILQQWFWSCWKSVLAIEWSKSGVVFLLSMESRDSLFQSLALIWGCEAIQTTTSPDAASGC